MQAVTFALLDLLLWFKQVMKSRVKAEGKCSNPEP
jgi:hypothetical protein